MTSKQLIEEYVAALKASTPQTLQDVMNRYISDQDRELKDHILFFQAGLPGYCLEPEDILAEGNKVVVRFRLKGWHTGELFGSPPSGRAVDVPGIIIYELAGEQIINHWMQADMAVLMQQINPKSTTSAE